MKLVDHPRAAVAGIASRSSILRSPARRARGSGTFPAWLELPLWLALVLALRISIIGVSVASDWDESVYVLMAQAWLHGGLPYVAVWDQHPVGLPAIIAMGDWFTTDTLLAARVELAMATALGAWVVTQFSFPSRARWLGGLVYVLLMSRPDGIAAQTEPFNATLVASASLLLFRAAAPGARSNLGKAAAAALILGCALQVKYTVLPECVLLCGLHLVLRRSGGDTIGSLLRRAGLLVACGLAPTVAAGAYFALSGQFGRFVEANLYANTTYLHITPEWLGLRHMVRKGLRPHVALTVSLGVLGILYVLRVRRRPRIPQPHAAALRWIGVWMLAGVLDVCLPMKFWPHYFLMITAPLCATLPFIVSAVRRQGTRRVGAVLAGCLVSVVIIDAARTTWIDLQMLSRRVADDVPRRIASAIQARGPGGIYVMDYQPIIYQLAQTVPPTRFVLPAEFGAFAESSGAEPMDELRSVLATQPRYIVTCDPPMVSLPPEMRDIVARELIDFVPALTLHDSAENCEATLYVRRWTAATGEPHHSTARRPAGS